MRRQPGVIARIASFVLAAPAVAAVLLTIAIDGEMGDWSAVLADSYQTSEDGPAGPLPDLDFPSVGSRDLSRFAWTFDSSYFYFYVARASAASGRTWLWLYLDTNEDGLMQDGEPAIHVSWWGNSRATSSSLYAYHPAAPGGDPLGDAFGRADGWTLPGSVSLVSTYLDGVGGSRDKRQVETRVPWSLLGLTPGTPMNFHVASSRGTSLPGDIEDNMGGPGGLVGSTRLAGVEIRPHAVSGSLVAGGVAVMAHELTNSGAAPDTIDLGWSASGDFVPAAVSFHHDTDGDGRLGAGDIPLADSDGDGLPDTGPLVAGAGLAILLVVEAPGTVVDGEAVDLRITATSAAVPLIRDVADDHLVVATPALTLVKSVSNPTAAPGTVLSYSVDYLSSGSVAAYNAVLIDAVPSPAVYQAGSAGGAGTRIEFSHDGGATFDGSDTAPVTHIRWSFLSPVVPGGSGQVSFRAVVP